MVLTVAALRAWWLGPDPVFQGSLRSQVSREAATLSFMAFVYAWMESIYFFRSSLPSQSSRMLYGLTVGPTEFFFLFLALMWLKSLWDIFRE